MGLRRVRSFALVGVALAGIALATIGASPSPDASLASSPDPSQDQGRIEVWLDRPVSNDAAPGSTVPIGATIWDRVGRTLITGTSLVAHLHPATGKAKATEAILASDIPGHVSGQIEIPPGGVGELDIGFLGSACTDSGCVATRTGLPIAGAGPPEGAPLPLVAAAEIQSPPPGSLVAGQATEVDIVLRPNVPWGDAFTMPDTLVLQVRVPRGPVLLDAPARLIDAASGRYRASVTLADAAQYVLQVASGPNASPVDTFATSLKNVAVAEPPAATAAPTPAAPEREGDQTGLLPLALLAVSGAMVVGLVLVVRHSSD